jgi:hypothetical protein
MVFSCLDIEPYVSDSMAWGDPQRLQDFADTIILIKALVFNGGSSDKGGRDFPTLL